MTTILIAGGGIGGLASALACTRLGAKVELFERSTEFAEVGAGIQLGPNVMNLLHGWGLRERLDQLVALPQRLQVRSATSGAELGVLRLGAVAVERYEAPYATIHRADLQALLLEVLGESDAQLHRGSKVSGYTLRSDGVTLHLRQANADLSADGDVLVGADGLWSQVRQQLLGDGAPRATGHLAYRAMVAQKNLPECLRSQQITAWLGPRLHVVQYPVRGGEWLNVVAIVEQKLLGNPANWDHQANAADLHRRLANTCAPLQDLIQAIEHWGLWGLSIRPPMRGPHEQAQGRVALLGDAAHPMLPYLAQGAGMAIEDAAELSQVLFGERMTQQLVPVSALEIAARLNKYAAKRWQRNARVQARAIRNGHIFHATGALQWGRDIAMRLLGERLLDLPWLYQGD